MSRYYFPSGNKYGNKKVDYDGHTFDSIKEYDRYVELKILEKAGKISNLETQVKFELIPATKRVLTKGTERACTYIADFVYVDNESGRVVVEDVKGFKTKEYRIKKKLMLWRFGLEIMEI